MHVHGSSRGRSGNRGGGSFARGGGRQGPNCARKREPHGSGGGGGAGVRARGACDAEKGGLGRRHAQARQFGRVGGAPGARGGQLVCARRKKG